MDQIKIGRFIAERRRAAGFTQMQLAEMLGITDRAVSKWENGKAMPDTSIMLGLCDALKITVNDLLCGEVVSMENYNKELENNLLEMVKQKEMADKRLLRMEILTGILSLLPLLAALIVSIVIPMEEWIATVVIILCIIPLLAAAPFMLRIEQMAGYYECKHCKSRHVPSYGSVFMALHMGRTRYMRCPKCKKYSWQKKVISKK